MKRTQWMPRGAGYGLALLLLVSLVAAGASGCTVWRMRQAALLASQSEPFEQQGGAAFAPAGRLLVVGDSTAVGTGASSAQSSVAGLIGRDHPGLSVTNLARDGARFVDIAAQLRGTERYDVVLVLGGGNDVIRLTSHERMVDGVRRTLAAAGQKASVVIFMPSGNVGNAPFFFPPWSWLMTRRSRDLHDIARRQAAHTGAIYVNAFAARQVDPFAQEPKRFNAADGLHPSDAGYALWYEALNRQAKLGERLKSLGSGPQAIRASGPVASRVSAGFDDPVPAAPAMDRAAEIVRPPA